MKRNFKTGKHKSNVHWKGRLDFGDGVKMRVEQTGEFAYKVTHPDGSVGTMDGWDLQLEEGQFVLLPKPNLVVDSGVQRALDRLFAINSTPGALLRLGVDNGASNPVAGTTQSGANTKTLLTFDSTPTRSSNVVTATRTFTNSNVNFAMKRLFLSANTVDITNSTTADTAGTLYSMTNVFTIDFTGLTSWSAVFAATVTGVGA